MSAEIEITVSVKSPFQQAVREAKKEITYVINDHLKGFRCTNWRGKIKPTKTYHCLYSTTSGLFYAEVGVDVRYDCKSIDEFMETFSDFINEAKQIEGFEAIDIKFTNTLKVTA